MKALELVVVPLVLALDLKRREFYLLVIALS